MEEKNKKRRGLLNQAAQEGGFNSKKNTEGVSDIQKDRGDSLQGVPEKKKSKTSPSLFYFSFSFSAPSASVFSLFFIRIPTISASLLTLIIITQPLLSRIRHRLPAGFCSIPCLLPIFWRIWYGPLWLHWFWVCLCQKKKQKLVQTTKNLVDEV